MAFNGYKTRFETPPHLKVDIPWASPAQVGRLNEALDDWSGRNAGNSPHRSGLFHDKTQLKALKWGPHRNDMVIMVISPAEAGKNSEIPKKWPEDRVEPSFAETEQR
jgi:hypothetical protein